MENRNAAASANRENFVKFLQAGQTFLAIRAARALLQDDPGIRQTTFICRQMDRLADANPLLKPLRVALLSSFSIELLRAPLIANGFLNGLRIEPYFGGFGQFRQEILDPASKLYAFSPDVVLLAVEGKDWNPALYLESLQEFAKDSGIASVCEEFRSLLQSFRSRSGAALLVHNFAPPIWRQMGILDARLASGQIQAIQRWNESFASICRETPGAYVVDYASLVARSGAAQWYDLRMDAYARAPISMEMYPHLACEYSKFFRNLTGQAKKCLVVDLDNTLWGGVVGELGWKGIQLGTEYPGNAYAAFQKQILNLHKRGVILAVASKNNPADVDDVFAQHPHMALKKEHFASMQVNWLPKSQSLAEIAKQLNIGLEHMVLLDDNPAECEEVGSALPTVTTICLPKQPELFTDALFREGLFDTLSFSSEDTRRGELYRQRGQAEALREQSRSLEDFYRNLEMEVAFAPVDDASRARSAQLTQKTNQFNLTTLRYSESDLARHMNDPSWLLTTVTLRDRFGDNGIIGLMMAQAVSQHLEIDTFLMSCRVIGRGVETAMLACLCEQGLRLGMKEIHGRVNPTAKNLPARDLFYRHGFYKRSESESGETSWSLNLEHKGVAWPDWLKIKIEIPVASKS